MPPLTNGFNIIFRARKTALASGVELMRTVLRGLAAIFFVVAGSFHFVKPELYLQIMPPYLPAPELLVAVSGLAEIAGGIGLLIRPLRRAAGWGLIALLIAIFPANIYMLQHPGQFKVAPWILWARLPLQAVSSRGFGSRPCNVRNGNGTFQECCLENQTGDGSSFNPCLDCGGGGLVDRLHEAANAQCHGVAFWLCAHQRHRLRFRPAPEAGCLSSQKNDVAGEGGGFLLRRFVAQRQQDGLPLCRPGADLARIHRGAAGLPALSVRYFPRRLSRMARRRYAGRTTTFPITAAIRTSFISWAIPLVRTSRHCSRWMSII